MKRFHDVTVAPTEYLRNSTGRLPREASGGIYRGGPVFPRFAIQVAARHRRGWLGLPRDARPRITGPVEAQAEIGLWCGPVSPHYGHMIADFGMRIATASRFDRTTPLVFSAGPAAMGPPPAFFWGLVEHFGVDRGRICLIERPTLFRTLLVPPQAERLDGPPPSRAHLDVMDEIVATNGPVPQDLETLFVSRARWPDGRLAGEPYVAEVLERAGVAVIQPEMLPVSEQVRMLRRARRILFSEGSALHTLQLLGRLHARVAVIARRPKAPLARAALAARVEDLAYWQPSRGILYGLNRRGRPRPDRALVLFDEADLVEKLRLLAPDIAEHWDGAAYAARLSADVAQWIALNAYSNDHPDLLPFIRRQLARLGLTVDVDGAWEIGRTMWRSAMPRSA